MATVHGHLAWILKIELIYAADSARIAVMGITNMLEPVGFLEAYTSAVDELTPFGTIIGAIVSDVLGVKQANFSTVFGRIAANAAVMYVLLSLLAVSVDKKHHDQATGIVADAAVFTLIGWGLLSAIGVTSVFGVPTYILSFCGWLAYIWRINRSWRMKVENEQRLFAASEVARVGQNKVDE